MKIYTKKGDTGKTSLLGGFKVNKDNIRVEAYGNIDELNSLMGDFISNLPNKKLIKNIEVIQNNLFLIGSYLADKNEDYINPTNLKKLKTETQVLEKQIDKWEQDLPKLTNFILPGGTNLASKAHIIRTNIRKCERVICKINRTEKIDKNVLTYINRLSDYFFVLARYLNFKSGVIEKVWKL